MGAVLKPFLKTIQKTRAILWISQWHYRLVTVIFRARTGNPEGAASLLAGKDGDMRSQADQGPVSPSPSGLTGNEGFLNNHVSKLAQIFPPGTRRESFALTAVPYPRMSNPLKGFRADRFLGCNWHEFVFPGQLRIRFS